MDTPRSEVMFGSLVVFFPTAHEGGPILMRTCSCRPHVNSDVLSDSARLARVKEVVGYSIKLQAFGQKMFALATTPTSPFLPQIML
jgi:hypothetical protein